MQMLRKMCASAGARFRGKLFTHIYIYIYNISFSVYTQQQPRSVSWCCSEPLFEISYDCEEPTGRLRIYAPGLSAGGMGELLLN